MRSIADYEFVRPLGSGEHGQCFLARRPQRLPVEVESVAVKVLYGESTADTFRRATRELKAVAALTSPYLVEIYDAGQHDGIFYYSMRYLPGGTLAGPAEPLERSAALAAVADAARGLADMHAARLVHTAVKPSNVLIEGGVGRLADPGLAPLFTPGVTLTAGGPSTGVEYSDPELLRGDPPKPAHDVWSLGLLVHWVATGAGGYGELPAGDGLAALRHVVSTPPVPSASLPAPLRDLVRECLAPAAARPSAAEVADRLAAGGFADGGSRQLPDFASGAR